MIIFYVRHGDPIYNPDSLTPLGLRQAEAVGRRLAQHKINKIFASTSHRAYQTSLPLAEMLNKEVTRVEFLNECHAADYVSNFDVSNWVYKDNYFRTLFASDEIISLGHKWYEHEALKDHVYKEGVEYFNKNIDSFLLELGYKHNREDHTYAALEPNNKRIAIFAHEGIGSVFVSSVLDIPYPIFAAHYSMDHTGVTVIQFDDEGDKIVPRLLQYSNDSHIYRESLPSFY